MKDYFIEQLLILEHNVVASMPVLHCTLFATFPIFLWAHNSCVPLLPAHPA
jgi:hypothetical protein